MGTWSADAFGNDTAGDWADALEGEDDLDLVVEALSIVTEDDGYLDADDACEALAACEVLARLKGNWGVRNSYTEAVDTWVESHPADPPAEIIAQAEQAIERILGTDSELAELWAESSDQEWRDAVHELRQRLTS